LRVAAPQGEEAVFDAGVRSGRYRRCEQTGAIGGAHRCSCRVERDRAQVSVELFGGTDRSSEIPVGMTARNLRAYQSLGLLAAPRLAGRVGLYGAEHLDRIRAIQRLQSRGFSLAGIKELFDAHARGQTLEAVLGLDPSLLAALSDAVVARLPRLALVPGPWAQELGAPIPAVN
jgi:DNA-binding transcriptional MerR regulator